MAIRLRVENPETLHPASHQDYLAHDQPFTIGDRGCSWVLRQRNGIALDARAGVQSCDGGFTLRALSPTGVILNQDTLKIGDIKTLADQDRLTIGDWRIRISLDSAPPNAKASSEMNEKTTFAPLSAIEPERTILASERTILAIPSTTTETAHASSIASDTVRAFSRGAGIDPLSIERRSDEDFAELLGVLFSIVVAGQIDRLSSQKQMMSLIGVQENESDAGNPLMESSDPKEVLRKMFGARGAGRLHPAASLYESFDRIRRREEILFTAMQTALFRLLNQLEPSNIAQGAGQHLLGFYKGSSWRQYQSVWERMNAAGENGLLDLFLSYMREAYEDEAGR